MTYMDNTTATPKITSLKNVVGTSLQGYFNGYFDSLVEVLGEPDFSDGDKVSCEWAVTIGGTPVTVYNWKDSSDPRSNNVWHIGGTGEMAVHALAMVMPTGCASVR